MNLLNLYHRTRNLKYRFKGIPFNQNTWDSLELISVHIPKTAGTTFQYILNQEYGNDHVLRIDIGKKTMVNHAPIFHSYSGQKVRVIHGHFNKNSLGELIGVHDHLPIITWLRNPVSRVISNYLYLKKMHSGLYRWINQREDHPDRNLDSLLEYAVNPKSQNRMTRFLKDMTIKDFTFIGIVEYFPEDIRQLHDKLNWSQPIDPFHKKNETKKKTTLFIPDDVKKKIAEYNAHDLELYNQVLSSKKRPTILF